MRDILQFDYTVDDSIDRITSAHRTCDLILGVGDGKVIQTIILKLFF
jgi:isopenicillin-N N-acyltransferase like protein